MMKLWTHLLLAALLVCPFTAVHAASVKERLQWQDKLNTGILPPADSAAWQAADKVIRRDLDAGTLWVRLRVHSHEREDLYLALRQVHVEDLSVGVQYPAVADGNPALQTVPPAMTTLNAKDVRTGKRLLRGFDVPAGEALIWIRVSGNRMGWFEADVLDAGELAQQRLADGAMHAMQLTFSMLLLAASTLLYWQSGKKAFFLMGLLGLLTGLYHLQLGGAFTGLLGDDLRAFVKLNASMTVVLDCAGLYASAKVLASPRFKLLYARGFSALLGGSLLMTALAYSTQQGVFHLAAVGLLSVALYGFCWDCARQWLQAPAWRKGFLNHLLVAVFLLMVATNLGLWSHLFASSIPLAWAEPLRSINVALISFGLMLTLLWRQQRAQSVKDRRRQANVQKLQEQSSIRFLQQLFISMLVHEIKTPLTVVQLGTSALVKKDIAPERKQAWDVRMHTAINSMVHVLDNCSQADRYEGGVMAVSLSHFLLTDTLDLVMGQAWVHSSAQSELLQLRIEKPMDDLRLHSDASYLQIILNNLLSNALKYSAQGSPVLLQVSQFASGQGAPMVQFAIRNVKGPAGHPDPAKVFERYYRSPTTSSISGTGLGLWLSQQLAWRLGTTIQLSLEAEQVVFWFTLPVDSAGATSA